MPDRLKDKTAFITAAASGIGRSTALAFAREGATVWATDINRETLSCLQKENHSIHCLTLDVMDTSAVESTVHRVEPVHVLFNCAGIVHDGNILECDETDWDLSFNLNVKSCYRTIRAVLPAMLRLGGGSIINMSSVASNIKGVRRRFVYGATKAAVIGLTRAVAADYVREGIRCNAICPGTVDTPSLRQRICASRDPVEARRNFENRQPMGRLGTAEEIAALAVFLASDESSYTTGCAHVIDGGWSI